MLCSIMFLSNRILTYESNSFEDVKISFASFNLGEFCISLMIDFEKLIMHLSGVNISWVTVEFNRCNTLFSASIIASLFT